MTGRVWESNTHSVVIDAAAGQLEAIKAVVNEVAREVGLTFEVEDWGVASSGAGLASGRMYKVEMKETNRLANVAKLNDAYELLKQRFTPPDGTAHGH